MNSLGLWHSKELMIEFDVNIFISSKYDDYIEFGLKCFLPKWQEDVSYEVFLFLPYTISKNNVKNIELSNDLQLLKSMFNEDISIEINKYTKIKYDDKKKLCIRNLYDFDVSHRANGSIIKVDLKHSSAECDNYYYRFRVDKLFGFKNVYDDNIAVVEWVYKKAKHIDFTINKDDKLPNSITDAMKHYSNKIHKINFFLITNDKLNIIYSSTLHHNIKTASEKWKKHYLNIKNNRKNDELIIYHFKQKDIFIKLSEVSISLLLKTLIIILIIFTIMANYKTIFGNFY